MIVKKLCPSTFLSVNPTTDISMSRLKLGLMPYLNLSIRPSPAGRPILILNRIFPSLELSTSILSSEFLCLSLFL